MKHTAGPWFNHPCDSGQAIVTNDCSICVISKWDDEYKDESNANARLISAAPDLLEALQALCLALEQDRYPSWEKGAPNFGKAEALANAAIAKATGETP